METFYKRVPRCNRRSEGLTSIEDRYMLLSHPDIYIYICNGCGKTENVSSCDKAYKIWNEIKPKLSEILDGKKIQCSKLTLKISPRNNTE